ncbi:MAG: MAPEG family protein [Rhodoblastus sp.]
MPGRTRIFLIFAAFRLSPRALGAHRRRYVRDDFSGYPDCRDDAIKAMQVGRHRHGIPLRAGNAADGIDKAATWALAQEIGGACSRQCDRGRHAHLLSRRARRAARLGTAACVRASCARTVSLKWSSCVLIEPCRTGHCALVTPIVAAVVAPAAPGRSWRAARTRSALATTGDPNFERIYRAHQNMLEWMPIFLPALWLFAIYLSDRWPRSPSRLDRRARALHADRGLQAAEKRSTGFAIQATAAAVLFVGALAGIGKALIAGQSAALARPSQ